MDFMAQPHGVQQPMPAGQQSNNNNGPAAFIPGSNTGNGAGSGVGFGSGSGTGMGGSGSGNGGSGNGGNGGGTGDGVDTTGMGVSHFQQLYLSASRISMPSILNL